MGSAEVNHYSSNPILTLPPPRHSAEARRHPKDVLALLIYLTSWKDMGSAEVTCEGGCSCTPSTVHGMAK